MSGKKIDTYLAARTAFIDDDRSLRRENVTIKTRSTKEAEADSILRQVRAKEAETIWKEDYPEIKHPFPGMEFLTGMKILHATRQCLD